MSRSFVALAALLTLLVGPLLFPPRVRGEQRSEACPAEAYSVRSVCTPAPSAVHPADKYEICPYARFAGEFGDPAVEAAWNAPPIADDAPIADEFTPITDDTPVMADDTWLVEAPTDDVAGTTDSIESVEVAEDGEDWRDFVVEREPSSITNEYDDLFESLPFDVAAAATASIPPYPGPAVVEADVEGYKAESNAAPEYDPYAENRFDSEVEAPQAEQPRDEVELPRDEAELPRDVKDAAIEAYESEFSGYGTTDYLRDNFRYEPLSDIPSRNIFADLMERSTTDWLNSALLNRAIQTGHDVWSTLAHVAAEHPAEQLIDASELAWDRLEEYRRQSQTPVPTVDASEGYRLADDDCGWDCWRDLSSAPIAVAQPVEVASDPNADADRLDLNREAIRSLALSLRDLSRQLEAASNWIARFGGIDVAELQPDNSAR